MKDKNSTTAHDALTIGAMMQTGMIRILLVDDDQNDAILIRNLLNGTSASGMQLETARSYMEGRQALSSSCYDICLVDFHLDERNGLDFIRESISEGLCIPFVIITGQDNRQLDMLAIRSGATDYLVKGELTPALFARAIRYAIDRKRSEALLSLARDEAMESSRTKSEFLANMSHEMRTPMNGVVGMLDLLAEADLPPKHREHLMLARFSAKNMVKQLDRVLEFIGSEEVGEPSLNGKVKQVMAEADVMSTQDPGRRLRVLLADDSRVTRLVFSSLLEKNGHEVVIAVNGSEAFAKFQDSTFDLILMDVQMPVMNGLSATRLIRAREAETGTHTPILALTAADTSADLERCLQTGMDGYLNKHITAGELQEVISRYVKQVPRGETCLNEESVTPELRSGTNAGGNEGKSVVSDIDSDELGNTLEGGANSLLISLRQALEYRDEALMEQSCLNLKRLAARFSNEKVADETFRMQLAYRRGDIANAAQLLASIESLIVKSDNRQGFNFNL